MEYDGLGNDEKGRGRARSARRAKPEGAGREKCWIIGLSFNECRMLLTARAKPRPVIEVACHPSLPDVAFSFAGRAKDGAAQDWAKSEETEADGADSYFRTRSVPDAEG